ncbi:MAG: hypothetical protein HEQ35_20315 [Gloeotrichia echinulata IR180]
MKITRIFQRLIALVAVVAVTFGFAASPASAATTFNAPYGSTLGAQYSTQLEVGVTVYNNSTGQMKPLCNNRVGTGAGPEWKSTCLQVEKLDPSEKYVVQAYSKPSGPGTTCWTEAEMSSMQIASPVPGNGRYLTTLFSQDGTYLAQLTLDGRALTYRGEAAAVQPPFKVCP